MACPCPAHHVKGFLGRRLFANPWPTWRDNSAGDMLRWMRERSAKARAAIRGAARGDTARFTSDAAAGR